MPDPTFSIIIPTRCRKDMLAKHLRILRRLPGPSREILVIDDASSDGTRAMLRDAFPDVRVLRNEEPRGFDALPDAIRATRGRLILQLDDDAYPAEGTLERIARHFERRGPRLGLVALPFVDPDSGRVGYSPYLAEVPDGRDHAPARAFFAGAVALRREAALAIPPSPAGYFMYETEPAATIEYLAAGWEADYLPSARVYHVWEARSGTSARSAYLSFRNDLVTMKHRYRGLRRSEMVVGRYLTGFVHLAAAGRPQDWWPAIREADRMLRTRPYEEVDREVLERVYPCFDGLTLATFLSESNRRRVAWFLGRLSPDQSC